MIEIMQKIVWYKVHENFRVEVKVRVSWETVYFILKCQTLQDLPRCQWTVIF
jgi:hypothetical protein